LGVAAIYAMVSAGPEKWKDSTFGGIKVAQTLMVRAEEDADQAKLSHPLPSLRDACIRESNHRIHSYARATRNVVIYIKQVLVTTNDHIKSLNRLRQTLDRSLDHCRKDLLLNLHCVNTRREKPQREKSDNDKGDELLASEHAKLFQNKSLLESLLTKTQHSLQMLNNARAMLSSVLQERSRVTELLCHSISSSHDETKQIVTPRHIKASSAPSIMLGNMKSGPLESLTPSVLSAIKNAQDICQKSQQLKNECMAVLDDIHQKHQTMHELVNQGITQRIAETITLSQHLLVNACDVKNTEQKTNRHLNQQEKALGYALGPVSHNDITKRERLDRPLVKVYQQHPGTDLPEAHHIIQATNTTLDSIAQTQRNISLLKLARKKLKEDFRDKKMAMEIDSNIVRLRRRRNDHRWVLQGNAITLQLANSVPKI
jgi:hypothetical protein